MKQQLRGVLGFPVTIFKKDLSLDLDALASNFDEMAKHPFCAMVAAGGTGKVYSMTVEESIAVVRATVDAVKGRMPVVAGVGYNSAMATAMARGMEKAGAQALLVMPPYYINAPEAGLIEYFKAIGASTGLPLSFYSRDWAVFTPAQVQRLADAVPSLQIWKDGQGDTRKYQRIMAALGDRMAWLGGIGDDCAPGYFAVGCQAYTSSISNISPKMSLAFADAGVKGDRDRMNAIMAKYVHPLYALRDRMRGYEVSIMKSAMEMVGLHGGPVRPPLCDTRAEDVADLRKLMELYKDFA